MMDAGAKEALTENEVESNNLNVKNRIEILVQDKSVLPDGYQWEEKGREFSFKGMFYDIVSIKKTNQGWVIIAASDEEEAAIVANQHKAHAFNKDLNTNTKSGGSVIKLNLGFIVYESNQLLDYNYSANKTAIKIYVYNTTFILSPYSGEIVHPPETV